MKAGVLSAAVVVCLSAPALVRASEPVLVPVADKTCPLTLHAARIVRANEDGLQIAYKILNPHRKTAESVIVAAAAVNETGRVRVLQTRPLVRPLTPRSTEEYVAEFAQIDLAPGERLVVGIQGVVWDKRRVWYGALPLARGSTDADAADDRKPRRLLQ
ncbi:MAG TPA: hypothetical protein VF147_10270 [Vicinamibacterales bacterium]